MASADHPLDRIQRWMQAVMTHPTGVEGGIDSDEARQEIDVGLGELERVLTRSRSLSAADRLGVYCGAYYARLLECLREEFPTVVHALERELFDEFAVGYLQSYPSPSYTLNDLGANFPRYLAETCPADEDETGWAAFLIDLATLERTYSEVFDGPGVEGRELLTPERLKAIPPGQWPDARLVPAPDLRLLKLRSPVHEYTRAVRREENPSVPTPAETFLAIHRRDYVVRRHLISRTQHTLLNGLIAGDTVENAIGQSAEHAGDDLDAFAADLHGWFQTWAAEGFFQAVVLSD